MLALYLNLLSSRGKTFQQFYLRREAVFTQHLQCIKHTTFCLCNLENWSEAAIKEVFCNTYRVNLDCKSSHLVLEGRRRFILPETTAGLAPFGSAGQTGTHPQLYLDTNSQRLVCREQHLSAIPAGNQFA